MNVAQQHCAYFILRSTVSRVTPSGGAGTSVVSTCVCIQLPHTHGGFPVYGTIKQELTNAYYNGTPQVPELPDCLYQFRAVSGRLANNRPAENISEESDYERIVPILQPHTTRSSTRC